MATGTALTRVGGALRRIFTGGTAKAEIGGNYWLPISGGWLPGDAPWNFFQMGWDPIPMGQGSVVAACVAAYAQTVAMCPGSHWRKRPNNGRDRVTNSDLSRILKRPNDYQTISDFFLNLTDQLYRYGNAYTYAVRNSRFEIAEVHIMDARISQPRIAVNGNVFYQLSGNPVVEKQVPAEILSAAPGRDVMHVKLNVSQQYRLVGEAPLTAAMLDVAASDALVRQALAYVQNQGRPSGIVYSAAPQTDEQMRALRARWEEMTKGPNVGSTVFLAGGLKWEPTSVTSRDEQIAELLQISDQRIATAFRMPLALLSLATGQVSGSATAASTGELMSFWISSGLGFALNHIEEAVGKFFQLRGWPDDYLELDTGALERSNQKDRIDALARGVQGGIYAPNEARAMEDLPAAEDGDEPRVQQQVVPLSFAGKVPAAPALPPQPPANENATTEEVSAAKAAAIAAFRRNYASPA